MSFNELVALPEEFAGLINLRYLTLTGNKFEEFPSVLQKMELVTIGMTKNRLSHVEITQQMPELKELDFFMNKLDSISFETVNVSIFSQLARISITLG